MDYEKGIKSYLIYYKMIMRGEIFGECHRPPNSHQFILENNTINFSLTFSFLEKRFHVAFKI